MTMFLLSMNENTLQRNNGAPGIEKAPSQHNRPGANIRGTTLVFAADYPAELNGLQQGPGI
jgi:hypothetical protein